MKKTLVGVIVILLLTSMLTLAFNIQQTECLEPPATEWSRTYGGTNDDRAYSMIQTSDGGYAITGDTKSFGAGELDLWLVKTDSDGNMEWNQTYEEAGLEKVFSLIQTSDGGFAIAGYKKAVKADAWLVKTDSNGGMKWNKTYGGAADDYATSMVQTPDRGYALAGYTTSFGAGSYDFWLVKTDSAGNMEWNRTYGGVGVDFAHSVVQTRDGGYLIAGQTYSFGAGDCDFWLVRTNSIGHMQWNKTYGGRNHESARSVVQTSDGGYAIAGLTFSFGVGEVDAWLVKIDPTGHMEWYQTYGGPEEDFGYSVVQTNAGGYVLAGYTESFGAGGYDFWLIKLSPVEIPAAVDIKPETLNLKSKGKWITAYIELPEGYDVNNINISTVMLNNTVPAESHPAHVGDYDNDTIPDLMVKFDRADVIEYILNTTAPEPNKFVNVTLTVTGNLYDDTPFEGSDTIKAIIPALIGRGRGHMQITPEKRVCGCARLFKMEDRLIQLTILHEDEEYCRTWSIISHRECKHGERYLCYNSEWGILTVGLHKHRRWQSWYAVGKAIAAFGFSKLGRLGLMPT